MIPCDQEDLIMGKIISMDIRERFCRYIEMGSSARAAGRALMISPATATRFARSVHSGDTLVPKKRGRKPGTGKLASYMHFLIARVEQSPDITLFELRDALKAAHGVQAHHSSIDVALKRAGLTYKKRPDRPGTRQGKGAQGPA